MKKFLVVILLSLVFFITSWPFFQNNFFYTHDFIHGARIVEMNKAFLDGHFPVRWSADFGYGYGMPLFQFYAPLPYYFGALIYGLGLPLVSSVKILFILTTLITIVGGYKLARELFNSRLLAIVCTTAITLAPYRAVNLYVRGALSELWAMMAFPLVLWAVVALVYRKKDQNLHYYTLLLVSLLIILLSHNLSALLFIPLSALFACVFVLYKNSIDRIKTKETVTQLVKIGATYLLAILISSFYTLPALLEKDFTRMEATIVSEYFDYAIHFVSVRQLFTLNWGYGGSTWGPFDDMSFYLGTGQLGIFVFGLFVFVKKVLKLHKNQSTYKTTVQKIIRTPSLMTAILFSVFFAIAACMTTTYSKFIWDQFSFLAYVQFPWRWLSVASLFLAVCGSALVFATENRMIRIISAVVGVVLIIVSSLPIFQPEKFISGYDAWYYSDTNRISTHMSAVLPDFIPIQVSNEVFVKPVTDGKVLLCELDQSCPFEYTVHTNVTHIKIIKVKLERPEAITFATADFPGWQTSLDTKIVEKSVSDQGLIQLTVPEGEHEIKITFKNTPVRTVANILSTLGILMVLAYYYGYRVRNN